jgi:hypothetical protein
LTEKKISQLNWIVLEAKTEEQTSRDRLVSSRPEAFHENPKKKSHQLIGSVSRNDCFRQIAGRRALLYANDQLLNLAQTAESNEMFKTPAPLNRRRLSKFKN